MPDGPSSKPALLIVDDDKTTRDGLRLALKDAYEVILAEDGLRALDILSTRDVAIVLSDVRMPGMDGLTLIQRALARTPGLICILLTAYGNVEMAVDAMKRGAYDFLTKPVNLDHLDLMLKRALRARTIESENLALRERLNDRFGLERLIGNAPVMRQVFDVIKQAAPTHATVLISGESGTGKELVAQAIHTLSPRSKGPLVAVHCASLSPTLLESELFGHEKGAFSGAMSQRHGRFESADGGTLFLDEISEIDLSIQVKLLRVLEERRFERVGGSKTLDVDIRLITATNKDLKNLVGQGKFREDLFFRLDVVNIMMPPLREREEDIPLLCGHFLKHFNQENGKAVEGLTPDAMQLLTTYAWPGNVRELRNTIEKMVVLARGNKLTVRDIPPSIAKQVGTVVAVSQKAGAPASGQVHSLAAQEREMIFAVLEKNGQNITKAAMELGISRRTLHRKLNDYREADGAAAKSHTPGEPA
jgi:two-component system response regulator AtoC